LAVIWACSLIQLSPAQAANPLAGCGFDFDTLSFSGTELQQAKCLLRPTKKGGNLGPALAVLPAPLEKVIGTPLKLDLVRFREYLVEQRIAPDALGGSLDVPLSRSAAGSKPTVRYFVIHDTSSNQCEDVAALSKSDDPNASWNTIKRWSNNDQAHLYLTRDGKLIAPQGRTFAVPFYATKLEKKNPDRTRGLFLHIENVQLRNVEVKPGEKTRDKDNECVNDRIAQKPGFTSVQYSRLALVYIAASHRAGKWLVPAYHLAVDDGVGSAHDDPQNFDLSQLGQNVCRHLTALDRNDCAP
jgi:hypothetical protein